MNTPDTFTPLVFDVDQLAKILSIGKNMAYELVRSGQVRSIKVGRCYRIPKAAIDEFLNPPAA